MANINVLWFSEIDKDDILKVGGKGANLGEMTKAKFPIPYGFVVTSQAFGEFIKANNLNKKIKLLLKDLNHENHQQLKEVATSVRDLIESSDIPKPIINKIASSYSELLVMEAKYFKKRVGFFKSSVIKLKSIYKDPFVAVRSSATSEDSPTASFAGQQDSYLNVIGETELINRVRQCWASLYTERSIYYRKQKKISEEGLGIAVVVQRMVQAEKSGIAFTVDPLSSDKNSMVIEAIVGLGEFIVQGKVAPDYYKVSKGSIEILEKKINFQKLKLERFKKKNKERKLNAKKGNKQKLTDEEIVKVALVIKDIEKHYFFPQDIEWAIEKNNLYIIQTRPITTLRKPILKKDKESKNYTELQDIEITDKPVLASGDPASPGIAAGKVVIIKTPNEISKIKLGDIMVAPQTNPDFVQAMKKASAIITEKGGRTSHAAIVSRELGIPAIVGVKNATKILKEGMAVKVNGLEGKIYKIAEREIKAIEKSKTEKHKKTSTKKLLTLTRIYVNLSDPDQAIEISKKHVDGIGLLRAEFIIADIGVHPKLYIKQGKEQEFVDKLSSKLLKFAKAFSPRPVIYRATDFKTNEYRNLKGGAEFEQKEENPMLGFRGAIRYIHNPEVFRMELKALKKIWDKHHRNIHLMIPFLRRPWELIKIKEIIESEGLFDLPGFKLYIMVEVPSVALELEDFLKIGVDGVSIGTNDLTMMTLGLDRDNENVADLYDERVSSVMTLLEHIVKTAVKYEVESGICGQAASDYPDLVENLIDAGITSLSINVDAIDRTRELVYNIEKRHGKKLSLKK
ncbi:MAG: phosphoenolpyruvate synthase [Patescibacteria group bacterium]